jgi:hypothetical protein
MEGPCFCFFYFVLYNSYAKKYFPSLICLNCFSVLLLFLVVIISTSFVFVHCPFIFSFYSVALLLILMLFFRCYFLCYAFHIPCLCFMLFPSIFHYIILILFILHSFFLGRFNLSRLASNYLFATTFRSLNLSIIPPNTSIRHPSFIQSVSQKLINHKWPHIFLKILTSMFLIFWSSFGPSCFFW